MELVENHNGYRMFPNILGEIEGLKKGIDTDLMLWEHVRKMDTKKLDAEYLVGFGVGFEKSQNIRRQIESNKSELSFEEKLELFKRVINEHVDNYLYYARWSNDLLGKIDNWGDSKLPKAIVNKSLDFLDKKLIQRAIDNIYYHYYGNQNLKAVFEFGKIKQVLIDIREQKKRQKIDVLESQKRKIELENQLREWIEKKEKEN